MSRVFAVADTVPEERSHFIAGKPYEVTNDNGRMFNITSETGNMAFCLWGGCAHLDGENWRRVGRFRAWLMRLFGRFA